MASSVAMRTPSAASVAPVESVPSAAAGRPAPPGAGNASGLRGAVASTSLCWRAACGLPAASSGAAAATYLPLELGAPTAPPPSASGCHPTEPAATSRAAATGNGAAPGPALLLPAVAMDGSCAWSCGAVEAYSRAVECARAVPGGDGAGDQASSGGEGEGAAGSGGGEYRGATMLLSGRRRGGGRGRLGGGDGRGGTSGRIVCAHNGEHAAHLHCLQCDSLAHHEAHCMVRLSLSVVGSHAQSLRTVGSHIGTSSQKLQPRQRHSEQCTPVYRASQKPSHL
eukprot:3360878-Prymnesium_polylepis.2